MICDWVDQQRGAGKACDLLDRPDGQGCTPLVMAVETNNWLCVRLLLDRGAQIDLPCPRQNYGYTPLMAAVCKENDWIMHQLLKEGADPLIVSPQGDTALSLAMKTTNVYWLTMLLKALPKALEQAAPDFKKGAMWAFDSAARLARAVTDLDKLMDDTDFWFRKDFVRPCRNLAHRLQSDSFFDKLSYRLKLYHQGARNARLRKSLSQAPAEWELRVALTSQHATNEGPIHSHELKRFYVEVSELARLAGSAKPADSDLLDLANECIVRSFERCSSHVNLHDGATLLNLISCDEDISSRRHPDTAFNCVNRTYLLACELVRNPDENIGGTQLVASLVKIRAAFSGYVLSAKSLQKGQQERERLASHFEQIQPDPVFRDLAIQHLIWVSSKGSTGLAAAMFLEAFRIDAEFKSKGIPNAKSAVSLFFDALSRRGQRHALRQLSKAEIAHLSAIIATQNSYWFVFGNTPAATEIQDFQQGRSYTPPRDDALYMEIQKQLIQIRLKYSKTPDLRTKALGEAIARHIQQFIDGAQRVGSAEFLARREAMAQTFVDVFSFELTSGEQSMALFQSLSTPELQTVRSWFDDENDTTKAIDALTAERIAAARIAQGATADEM